MPFDSNGTFNRVILGGWQADAAAGTKITAIRHDLEDDGFATGLSTCITKDGHTQPLANIPMNNFKIIDLGEPTAPDDAATKNYVDTFKSFGTGLNITGAGSINGFLNFTSPTGVNGIGWVGADLSWVAKLATASPVTKNRLVLNDKANATGTDKVTINDDGSAAFAGAITANTNFVSSTVTATLAAANGGQILLRPNGPASATEQVEVTSLGLFVTSKDIYAGTAGGNGGGVYAGLGIRERAGTGGGYGTSWINFDYVSGTDFNAYVGTTLFNVTVTVCDYRIKQDVAPLESMWTKVKALRPVSYTYADYEVIRADGVTRWGFLAHEVQKTLTASAAKGEKDGQHLQSLDVLAIISALTCALQEAMARIEALETAA